MKELDQQILKLTSASSIKKYETVQSLWSGYGKILRCELIGGKYRSIIIKKITLPEEKIHPRGWNTHFSHQRKLKSYQVETYWYQHYAQLTHSNCLVPKVLMVSNKSEELLIIMEDLNDMGYHFRRTPNNVSITDAQDCLKWLAHFHGRFMNYSSTGLWPTGTYWHLETRPEEYNRMQNRSLKEWAYAIDEVLKNAKYQTIVHGDAKLANFCFSNQNEVAAVDFQYVGKGCGMKDVAYFISSCFDEDECEIYEKKLLHTYFLHLEKSIDKSIDFQSLKEEWLHLYNYSWADFCRFLDGWSPGHWKMHSYSSKLTNKVVEELKGK